jgi:hypothetical protein
VEEVKLIIASLLNRLDPDKDRQETSEELKEAPAQQACDAALSNLALSDDGNGSLVPACIPSDPAAPAISIIETDGSITSLTPTPGPIRLGDEIDWMIEQFEKYVSLPSNGTSVILALWAANTYTYENFPYTAYLAIRSATPQCGKSRLLSLIGSMCLGNPQPTTMPTAAVLYRNPNKVMLLDEVDKLRNQDKEIHGSLIAVLNSGFEQRGRVDRMKDGPGGYEVESFNVYGPKAFAGIESVTDTIASRSLTIRMERATERKPRLNMRLLGAGFELHRTRLGEWGKVHGTQLQEMYAALPDSLPALERYPDRMQDIVEPLYLLAELADQERPEGTLVLPRLLTALSELHLGSEVSSRERGLQEILDIVRSCLRETSPSVDIASQDMLEKCQSSEELSWMQTTNALAGFLKHFGISPKSNGKKRGYTFSREWVEKMERIYPKSV